MVCKVLGYSAWGGAHGSGPCGRWADSGDRATLVVPGTLGCQDIASWWHILLSSAGRPLARKPYPPHPKKGEECGSGIHMEEGCQPQSNDSSGFQTQDQDELEWKRLHWPTRNHRTLK